MSKESRATFWSRPGTFAIVGGFESPQKLSWMLLQQCQKEDVVAAPVNPVIDEVLGMRCVRDPADIPSLAAIVCVRLDPYATTSVEQAAQLGVPVWLSRSTASESALAKAAETGAEVISGACPLMYMSGLHGSHKLHLTLAKIFRAY
jgi:predicted CoA-binding protein